MVHLILLGLHTAFRNNKEAAGSVAEGAKAENAARSCGLSPCMINIRKLFSYSLAWAWNHPQHVCDIGVPEK